MIWKNCRILWWILIVKIVVVVVQQVEGRKKKGDTIILHHGKKCIPTIIKSGGRVKGDFILVPSHQQKECQREKDEDDGMKGEESKTVHPTFVPYWMPYHGMEQQMYGSEHRPVFSFPIIHRRIVYHYIQPVYQPYYQPASYSFHSISGRDYFGPGQYQHSPTWYSYLNTLNRQTAATY